MMKNKKSQKVNDYVLCIASVECSPNWDNREP